MGGIPGALAGGALAVAGSDFLTGGAAQADGKLHAVAMLQPGQEYWEELQPSCSAWHLSGGMCLELPKPLKAQLGQRTRWLEDGCLLWFLP